MKISAFDYNLPENLIASHPAKRGESRLLIVERKSGNFRESKVKELPDILSYPIVAARNNTKVVKTRLFAEKKSGAKIEFLILNPYSETAIFQALIRPARKITENEILNLGEESRLKIIGRDNSVFNIELMSEISSDEVFKKYGHTPLPHYIKRDDTKGDESDYQTVYAKKNGASAAPTAGLHFDEKLLKDMEKKGCTFADVLLHVGLGTFEKVKEENVEEHMMHEEYYSLEKQSADILNEAKKNGTKILSIGTTTLRVLESVLSDGAFEVKSGHTDIFIYPPYKIESIDMLFTNFHLPKSTLLMLVSAFAGREIILDAYDYAVEHSFRFFSYGDAMLIL